MTEAQRTHLRSLMDFLYAHRGQYDYPPGDVRTAEDAHDWTLTEQQVETLLRNGGRIEFDCSEDFAWKLKCIGVWPWTYPGFTGTDLGLPTYTNPKSALIGAGVVFGPGTGHHIATVYLPDHLHGNPLLQSHGRPGVDRVRLDVMAAEQHAAGYPGVRLVSIAHL